jgi:hypothetical protein
MSRRMKLWERIYDAAAAAARDPACLQYIHLFRIARDLIDRGSKRGEDLIDEALARSRIGQPDEDAMRAELQARAGHRARYLELAARVERGFDEVDADDRANLAGHLAAGAEALGLTERADALTRHGDFTSLLVRTASERDRPARAAALSETKGFRAEHWSARQDARFALARAYRRAGNADAARDQVAEAEDAARKEKKKEIRWIHLTRAAAVYADVGAMKDARRLALELDKAMFEKVAPRGSAQYEEIAVVLHLAGDPKTAHEIALQHVASERVQRSPYVAARLWAHLGETARAHEVLDPLDRGADRGKLPGLTTHTELARIHLVLDDVAAALRRAAAEPRADQRVDILREIAAYAHEHGTSTSAPIEKALAAVLDQVRAV